VNILVRRRLWWVLALVTAVTVALTTGGSMVGRLVSQATTASGSYTDGVTMLDLDVTAGSVEINPGPPGVVKVSQEINWTSTKPTVDVREDQVTHTLRIHASCDSFGPFSAWGCGVGLRITAPPQTVVRTVTRSGSVFVDGLTGPLDLTTTSGSITVQDVTGNLQATTSSGAISGQGLRSASAVAETGSGSMDLTFAVAPKHLEAGTGSGSIDLIVPRNSHYRVNQNTGSGHTDVAQGLDDSASPNLLSLSVGSGVADVEYG
jgi:hypothetical protein